MSKLGAGTRTAQCVCLGTLPGDTELLRREGRVLTFGIAIRSPVAILRALLAARGVYLPDPERATAGIHFANVLRALGIYDSVRPRLRPFPDGATAMRAMADAGEPDLIGCTQVTEINYTGGVSLVGVLPSEFELATTYLLAVCSNAAEPARAREFAALLAGPESRALRVQGGLWWWIDRRPLSSAAAAARRLRRASTLDTLRPIAGAGQYFASPAPWLRTGQNS